MQVNKQNILIRIKNFYLAYKQKFPSPWYFWFTGNKKIALLSWVINSIPPLVIFIISMFNSSHPILLLILFIFSMLMSNLIWLFILFLIILKISLPFSLDRVDNYFDYFIFSTIIMAIYNFFILRISTFLAIKIFYKYNTPNNKNTL